MIELFTEISNTKRAEIKIAINKIFNSYANNVPECAQRLVNYRKALDDECKDFFDFILNIKFKKYLTF